MGPGRDRARLTVFSRILVANRGEIAVRVLRACRELGVEGVAVYSEADRRSPHLDFAQEALPIGPAPAAESYLSIDRVVEAAVGCEADAVHPGYGFLAENPDFALALEREGIVFIGPTADALRAMGDKTEARRRMREAGVPVVPGSDGPVTGLDEALAVAGELGYPVLLKAAAGGGGKGMRVVEDEGALEAALRAARSEATQAFGDERVYVERYLRGPRHVEVQVLADARGEVIQLGERDCSIQRRHQKLIEETPAPGLDRSVRGRMGDVAIAAARAVAYRGAGTVEFLYEEGEFYFLEMNTRIQVEHPITELVTGVDLVQWQIRIAAGEPLDIEGSERWPGGHALECRISGEDPYNGFLPSNGRVEVLRVPAGPGVRWDAGIAEGTEVGLHYDPLLAKLIVHARDRESAIRRMRRALVELHLGGVATTQPFHLAVMAEPDFLAGGVSIHYLDRHPELVDPGLEDWRREAALTAAVLLEERRYRPDGLIRAGKEVARSARGRPRSDWQRQLDGNAEAW